MTTKYKITIICGSNSKKSANLYLIQRIISLYNDKANFELCTHLTSIPHFNPDLENSLLPENVARFRQQLFNSDGILICSPEYAMGVPGTLKNAIDWTVSSMTFHRKPVALITGSLSGEKAHESLLGTLRVLEAEIPETSQLLISFIRAKVNSDTITDEYTRAAICDLMKSFFKTIGASMELKSS